MRQDLKLLVASALAGLAIGVAAHGGIEHERKAGPARKEQKDWGIAGDTRAVGRTIEVTMGDDMRFKPARIEVRQGEVVKLLVHNNGLMFHEIVIGTRRELEAHAALMAKFPNMEHDEPYMAHVKPSTTGQLIWNFNRTGEFDFACLVAGHYEAGMRGTIGVKARERK